MCRLHVIALDTENRPSSDALRSCGGPRTADSVTPGHHQRDSRDPVQENPGSFWQIKDREKQHTLIW